MVFLVFLHSRETLVSSPRGQSGFLGLASTPEKTAAGAEEGEEDHNASNSDADYGADAEAAFLLSPGVV